MLTVVAVEYMLTVVAVGLQTCLCSKGTLEQKRFGLDKKSKLEWHMLGMLARTTESMNKPNADPRTSGGKMSATTACPVVKNEHSASNTPATATEGQGGVDAVGCCSSHSMVSQ